MRYRRYRLPARLGVASVLAALVLPLAAAGTDAAGSGISLTVHLGYQDVIKAGEWMPVTVDVHSSGPAVDGTLETQVSLNSQPYVSGLGIYQQPISLAGGATKRIRMYLSIDASGASVTARIVQNGRVVASQATLGSSTTSTLIGVLSDGSTTLDDFAAIHPASAAARVVHVRLDEIPESAIALRAFDILAIDDFATDSLTAGQRNAIADYVYNGGDLLIGTGAAWHKTLAGLPAAILPMAVSGTAVVDATTPGSSAVEVATGTITGGHVWLGPDNQPLIVERSVGAGTVNLATFDWNQQPVDVSGDGRTVLRQVMARAIFSTLGQTNYGMFGGPAMMGGPFGGGRPSLAVKSGALTSVLGNLPGLELPSLQLTGLLVLLYVLIVGPINYLVLGAMHRRALAWITVPLIAIIASAGAYGAGVFTKGRSIQANQVAIVHLQPGWNHAYQETYVGVIPPARGDYQAAVGGEPILISPIATGYGGPTTPSLRVDVRANAVTMAGMTAFSLSGFASEGMASAPPLTAHLSLVNGKLVANIENHSNVSFTDGVLIAGDAFVTFGALMPGATTSVEVTPTAANAMGQPIYMRVYNSNVYYGGYGPGGPSMSDADRDRYAKSQILAQLTTGGSFKGVYAPATPIVVVWTRHAFQDVTVNGDHPRSTALAAVALSLPVDQIGTGTLPAGVITSRIVDVVGDSQGQGPPGTLVLQNGSVTYEFSPNLTAGTRLTAVSVKSQNPYVGKFVGAPGSSGNSPGVTGQIWDWTRSAWTDIAYQDNGTTSLPDSAVHATTGLIRLRISASNGGFLADNLALSGTVQ